MKEGHCSNQIEEVKSRITSVKKEVVEAFRNVVCGFLGCNKSDKYEDELLNTFEAYGCKMSIKLHFLHSRLNFFIEKLEDVGKVHRERFHQELKAMENRCQGRWEQ